MRVDPGLAAFAADPRAMARAQGRVLAAREQWLGRAPVARVLRDCDALAGGAPWQECANLRALIEGDDGSAQRFVEGWFTEMADAWRATPLAQMPFRHSYAGGTAMLHLYRSGRVTLAILAVEPDGGTAPRSIAFTDCERRERVVAGHGEATRYVYREGQPPRVETLGLGPGTVLASDAHHSRVIAAHDAPVLVLRVARDPARPALTREVEIASGRIVHRASASPAEGRAVLAAALLGAMGWADAAPALCAYACGQAGEGARWQALRHALALDTQAGFAALDTIAEDRGDPLCSPATALRAQLCTTYPQLANLRREACLAS